MIDPDKAKENASALAEALQETLRMLSAAHLSLGMPRDNRRVRKAQAVLDLVIVRK